MPSGTRFNDAKWHQQGTMSSQEIYIIIYHQVQIDLSLQLHHRVSFITLGVRVFLPQRHITDIWKSLAWVYTYRSWFTMSSDSLSHTKITKIFFFSIILLRIPSLQSKMAVTSQTIITTTLSFMKKISIGHVGWVAITGNFFLMLCL